MFTRDDINIFFTKITTVPGENVFSERGFRSLAEWSEQQPWWPFFAFEYALRGDWRSTGMGESHLFAVNLFMYLNDRSQWPMISFLQSAGGEGGKDACYAGPH